MPVNPTSLKIILGETFDLMRCLEELCSFIEVRYLQAKSLNKKCIEKEYESLLYKYEEWTDYLFGGDILHAKIIGITNEGKLILVSKKGDKIVCGLKEIAFI